ncbi:MAG: AMP-binding protein, partial [Oscillospiraceae bacterium]|nr:AMP-binding protein [Oscillospiraceae bacterium]
MSVKHFNFFNVGEESFFTPGTQLANIARVKPDAPAVIYISPENVESRMTWRELEVLSNRIAWYLIDLGIKPGKSVIVALPNIPTHIAIAFAIWKAGGCYVPVSNRTPQRNMAEICECVSPSLVITNRKKPAGYESLTSAELKELSADKSDKMPPDILAIPNLANCSGGTTGKTKVIEQHLPAGESDESLKFWFSITGMRFEMRQLLAGPLFHGAPHSAAFNGLYSGNTLVMPASLDAQTIVDCIKKYQIQFVQMVPTLMQRIIKMPG